MDGDDAADAFNGILAWAIGQAKRHTPAEVREKVNQNLLRNTQALLPSGATDTGQVIPNESPDAEVNAEADTGRRTRVGSDREAQITRARHRHIIIIFGNRLIRAHRKKVEVHLFVSSPRANRLLH